ncbi:uncharacterized protein LOC143462006 [Clavelina lepadiformis]|uniref:Uncharacterized protein n=1 Tax=Clavelina lepadiformis TaxID=159417 RepID=A0ABP0FN73_CLALP
MDPWNGSCRSNGHVESSELTNNNELGFADSFLAGNGNHSAVNENIVISAPLPPREERADAYLHRLEGKLLAMQHTSQSKLSANGMIKSLQLRKEIFFENVLDSTISDSTWSEENIDYIGSTEESFPKDIHRKLYPEHHAVNKVELLALLQHDTLSKIVESPLNQNDDLKNTSVLK